MIEQLAVVFLRERFPILLNRLKQGECAHDIGAGESERILYRAVNMALGGKVDYAVDIILAYDASHLVEIGDVGLLERIVGLVFDVNEIGKIAGIGEFVEIDDMVVGIFVDEKSDYMATDKPGATSYEYVTLHCYSDY